MNFVIIVYSAEFTVVLLSSMYNGYVTSGRLLHEPMLGNDYADYDFSLFQMSSVPEEPCVCCNCSLITAQRLSFIRHNQQASRYHRTRNMFSSEKSTLRHFHLNH